MPPTTQNDQTVTGVLERIIYFNEENAYCVAEVQITESKGPVTVLGNLPGAVWRNTTTQWAMDATCTTR